MTRNEQLRGKTESQPKKSGGTAVDWWGRSLKDLRLSVTDRCNFRCNYCLPKEQMQDPPFLPKSEILTFEELEKIAKAFLNLGVEKIRITGGEPLLRRDLPVLIEKISSLNGLRDLAMTTNGSALAACAERLKEAGLRRLTVSVDAMDDALFRRMNDVDFPLHRVLRGIDKALETGFDPIKINMVVKRGWNEDQILPMVRHFSGPSYILRFIEYMDVGTSNGWRLNEVVPASTILAQLSTIMDLQPLTAVAKGEVATRYRCRATGTEIGIISSVSKPFCSDCTRARVSADGQLYTCLFATQGHDLRALLRSGISQDRFQAAIQQIWASRSDRYSEHRAELAKVKESKSKVEMSRIGG